MLYLFLIKSMVLVACLGAGLNSTAPCALAAVTLPEGYVMQPPEKIRIPGDTAKAGVRIILFGDGGTGDAGQMQTADSMRTFCARNGCDFALMLGDNIHPRGVHSVDDPQFIEKFEKPYGAMGIPVFGVLGQHDWGRNGEMYNWKAQVEYTRKSAFWRMPSDVYSVDCGNLKILALNTNSIRLSKAQTDWLGSELEGSGARWNLVIGHDPIHAYGRHGDIDFMVAEVLPILCGRADLYASAHEHSLQVLKADCGLTTIISGAASKLRPGEIKGPRSLFAALERGFAYLVVKDAEMTIQMVSASGTVLYEQTLHPKGDKK